MEILNELKKSTRDFELYLENSKVNELHIEKNRINFSNKIFGSGYGVRVVENGMGFSSSNDVSKFSQVIKDAVRTSKLTEKINFQFPKPKQFKETETIDKKIKLDGEQSVKDYAQILLNSMPQDVLVSFGKIRSYDNKIRIVNSEGLDAEREETTFMVELSLIVEKNNRRMEFWPHEYRRRIQDLQMSEIEKWVKIAKDQLVAEEPKTEKTTIIFSPSTVLDGLGSVLDLHTSGSAKVNDVSKFSKDEKVGSEKLTVISDGLYPFGLMTSSFDDEGVPQKKTALIENGVFKNFVYDQFYALKDNVESTGNGLRQSDVFYAIDGKFGGLPSNQISNFHVKPGKKSLDQMISEIKNGMLVEQFSWMNPNSSTGNFSSEIRAGYYIENGEITKPIKGGLVSGNWLEMIKNIFEVSNESQITSGGTLLAGICPYIGFENVQVAGK